MFASVLTAHGEGFRRRRTLVLGLVAVAASFVAPSAAFATYGSVTGYKFHDLNGDGIWQKTGVGAEPGLAGWRIYIDTNNDGQRQASEPSAVTGSSPAGRYTISSIHEGDRRVREEAPSGVPAGWRCTAPTPSDSLPGPVAWDCGHLVRVVYAQTATTNKSGQPIDFGNVLSPKLTVTKHVVNDSGGSSAASAFQMDVTAVGILPADQHFAGNETGRAITASPGAYSVDESGGPSGYAKTKSAGCSGTLVSGDDKTCTITNNDQPAHLTVIKHVVNDNGGAAAGRRSRWTSRRSRLRRALPWRRGGRDRLAGRRLLLGRRVGRALRLREDQVGGLLGTLAPGGSATCTITNNDQPAHLTVIKHVVNDDGGSAAASAFQMDLTGGHVSDAHFPGVKAGNTVSLDAGSYSVDESVGPSGYAKAKSAGCSGTLAPGGSATCTITNDDIAPRLTVIKHVVGGGEASSFTMNVDANDPSDASFPGVESPGTTVTVNAGHYSVDEGDHAHYTATRSEGCEGTVSIGQERTCTITNVKRATVLVQKLTVPADTAEQKQTFGFHTNLTGDETFALSHGQIESREVEPGTYGVVEDDPGPAGYKLIGLECVESGSQDSEVVGNIGGQRSVSIHAQAGETIRCVYTNGLVVGGIEVRSPAGVRLPRRHAALHVRRPQHGRVAAARRARLRRPLPQRLGRARRQAQRQRRRPARGDRRGRHDA